jgi:hypothetical protein
MSHFTAGCPYPHDQCKCCQPADEGQSRPPADLVTTVAHAIREIDGGYADDWSDCAQVAIDAVRSWDAMHAVWGERDDVIELLRQDVGRLTRERDEWEANEQEQYREVQRLQAMVDRYDAFFDDAFPDDPFLKGSLDGEWDAFQRRHGGRP